MIRRKLLEENGIALTETQRIVVTAGGNMAFMNALLAIADPGDQIILQLPYYFNHEMAISMVNCEAVCVPTDAHYQLQLDAIRNAITDRTRAIVTISPNNPAGVVYAESDLRAVNALCREAGLYHISDEAYEYFTYDGARHFSPGSIADSSEYTISLYSLSKAYGFASWRIGWMVAPDHLYTAIKKAQDTILICPPVVSQYAAVAAMQVGSAYCREKLRAMIVTRRIIQQALNELGELITLPRSDGAFYFLLRVRTDMDAMTLAEPLDQRASCRGHSQYGLRSHDRLLSAYLLRRAGRRDSCRGEPTAGTRAAPALCSSGLPDTVAALCDEFERYPRGRAMRSGFHVMDSDLHVIENG